MRRSKRSHSLVAAILILAMVASITVLFGASGTTVRITSPASGARVSGHVSIQASIKTTAEVSYVLLGVDGSRPYSTNSAPYVFALDTRTLPDGPHSIFAEAYDRYGMLGSSEAITIYVKNGSAPAVQVQTESPATQVAEQPKAASPARVAASRTTEERARTASGAAAAPREASVSPAVSSRGPQPEPVRTASLPDRAVDRVRGHTVVLDGRPVAFDVAPTITKGRMRVGFRAMFERVGAVVSWIPETRTARSVQPALQVEVPVGQRVATVNGRETDLGMRTIIRNGRTIVPLRFFADATGSALRWDAETRTASVGASTVAIAERAGAD